MLRLRHYAVVAACLALLTASAATPVLAEPIPATLSFETSVSHYLGGDWEHQVSFFVDCGNQYAEQEIFVDLPGGADDVLSDLGPIPGGTTCRIQINYWPDAGWNATFEEPAYTPGAEVVLGEGVNLVTVDMVRLWAGEWPPEDDQWFEHDMDLSVTRILLNRTGGIEVEGTSWCPQAADTMTGDQEGDLYANANWTALQYVGKKTAVTASYESAIAHPCWEGSAPDHGPYDWQTRYPYPKGTLQYVYALNGKFSNKSIHVEAFASTETWLITENFAPEGWTSFEGMYVPYDPEGVDNNGDGWSVSHHAWYGWDQENLKPIAVR